MASDERPQRVCFSDDGELICGMGSEGTHVLIRAEQMEELDDERDRLRDEVEKRNKILERWVKAEQRRIREGEFAECALLFDTNVLLAVGAEEMEDSHE